MDHEIWPILPSGEPDRQIYPAVDRIHMLVDGKPMA
jgi:hypothetical protein